MAKIASSKKKRGGKKGVKSSSKKSKSTEVVYHSTKEIKVEKELIENFIGLQKVMVNLSSRFDNLSSQISRLLNLFEVSARALARKEVSPEGLDAKKVMDKLENISQQAGLIGKGLALIHEVGTENERPIIPVQKKEAVQRSSVASPVYPAGSSAAGPSPQKMTQDVGEFEKSKDIRDREPEKSKDRKLTGDADRNAGTNI